MFSGCVVKSCHFPWAFALYAFPAEKLCVVHNVESFDDPAEALQLCDMSMEDRNTETQNICESCESIKGKGPLFPAGDFLRLEPCALTVPRNLAVTLYRFNVAPKYYNYYWENLH